MILVQIFLVEVKRWGYQTRTARERRGKAKAETAHEMISSYLIVHSNINFYRYKN